MIYQKTGCAMPSPNRYLSNFEYMFVFSKGKPKTYNLIEIEIDKEYFEIAKQRIEGTQYNQTLQGTSP